MRTVRSAISGTRPACERDAAAGDYPAPVPIIDVTHSHGVSPAQLQALAVTLPHAVSAAVECAGEPYDHELLPGDAVVRFHARGPYDSIDLDLLIEVRSQWFASRAVDPGAWMRAVRSASLTALGWSALERPPHAHRSPDRSGLGHSADADTDAVARDRSRGALNRHRRLPLTEASPSREFPPTRHAVQCEVWSPSDCFPAFRRWPRPEGINPQPLGAIVFREQKYGDEPAFGRNDTPNGKSRFRVTGG